MNDFGEAIGPLGPFFLCDLKAILRLFYFIFITLIPMLKLAIFFKKRLDKFKLSLIY